MRVKYAEADRRDPGLLGDIPVPSRAGFTLPLSDIAELSYRFGDSEIQRKDKQRMVEVLANISAGTLSEVRSLIDAELEKVAIPPGVTIRPYYDRTELVQRSIRTVVTNLTEGGLLVVAVLLLLLGNGSLPKI